jgi:hypothetical protein
MTVAFLTGISTMSNSVASSSVEILPQRSKGDPKKK